MAPLSWLKNLFGKKDSSYSLRKDQEDFRNWSLIADYEGKPEVVEDFPDFHVAYIQAAYPTKHSEDHETADVELLRRALGKVKQESTVHARLCTYSLWSGDYVLAFKSAIQFFIMVLAVQRSSPGDHIVCGALVSNVLSHHGFGNEASRIAEITSGFDPSRREKMVITKAMGQLQNQRYHSTAKEAVRALRRMKVV